MIRDEIRQFLRNDRELFVRDVLEAAGRLNVKPIHRAVVGCLKALGDRFGSVTKDELIVAVLVVQIQCAHTKSKCERSENG